MLRDVLGLDDGDRGQKIFFFKNVSDKMSISHAI
jgi:hypothetical protein